MAGSGVSQKCVECGEMLSQPNILFFPFFCKLFFFFVMYLGRWSPEI